MRKINHQFCKFFVVVFLGINGCNSGTKNTIKSESKAFEAVKENRQLDALMSTGIDFFAEGNQPSNWTLKINFSDTIRFLTEDGISVKFAYNQVAKKEDADKTTYSIDFEGKKLNIDIFNKVCSIPNNNNNFSKEVMVSCFNIMYKGCGKFLADSKLQGKWVVEKIDGKLISSSDYNQLPFLEFTTNNVSGNDGCNRMGAPIEIQGKQIKFGQFFSTKMACGKKDIAELLQKKINDKSVDYYFKEDKLYFYLIDDSVLIFTKANK